MDSRTSQLHQFSVFQCHAPSHRRPLSLRVRPFTIDCYTAIKERERKHRRRRDHGGSKQYQQLGTRAAMRGTDCSNTTPSRSIKDDTCSNCGFVSVITACKKDCRNDFREEPALVDLSAMCLSRAPEKVQGARAAVPSACKQASVSLSATDSSDPISHVDFTESDGPSIVETGTAQRTMPRENTQEDTRKLCKDARQPFWIAKPLPPESGSTQAIRTCAAETVESGTTGKTSADQEPATPTTPDFEFGASHQWSTEWDSLLLHLRDTAQLKWQSIAAYFPERLHPNLRRRHQQLVPTKAASQAMSTWQISQKRQHGKEGRSSAATWKPQPPKSIRTEAVSKKPASLVHISKSAACSSALAGIGSQRKSRSGRVIRHPFRNRLHEGYL